MADANSFVRAYFEGLMDSQYWPAERMIGEQRKYLSALIRHARAHVPFYAHRFDGVMTPGGDIDWDRWHEVPIVTRADALAHNEAMLSTELPAHQGPTKTSYTSGSTGVGLRVVQSMRANMVHTASAFRTHYWHGYDWSRDILVWIGENPEKGRLPDVDAGQPWGPPWEPRATGKRFVVNRFNTAEQVLGFMRDKGIGYLSARPAAADAAARESTRLEIGVNLKAYLAFGTGPRPDERETIEQVFGAPTVAAYSSTEGHLMAFQCPTGTHYHINEEHVLIEVVDAQGKPCPPGVEGRVVVTPLYNFAQPLIRYEQGDLAVLGQRCSCGRTLRVIERISGRVAHMFRFPNGQHVAMSLSRAAQAAFGARYWQIAQVAPMTIEVRYVPIDDRIGDEAAVTEMIRQKSVPDVQVKFSRRADLNRADGRKFIEYVYEMPD